MMLSFPVMVSLSSARLDILSNGFPYSLNNTDLTGIHVTPADSATSLMRARRASLNRLHLGSNSSRGANTSGYWPYHRSRGIYWGKEIQSLKRVSPWRWMENRIPTRGPAKFIRQPRTHTLGRFPPPRESSFLFASSSILYGFLMVARFRWHKGVCIVLQHLNGRRQAYHRGPVLFCFRHYVTRT
ncbi:uncharacterized protein EV420DRAFT_266020 [Desarmillaria tabescens]|uniref:Uncharacterized protein n=1 Tax=Armillaria tabescens TaxID=1929756 RepID=A0AA39MJP2_ARMTA|nr:uncharacterized protein EV420DRAFT_266020 [Desarmillaria tabescens]KAK0435920.1 hypothetical protein EV420DRAFT_266020 [Desarmillaria tabescens]